MGRARGSTMCARSSLSRLTGGRSRHQCDRPARRTPAGAPPPPAVHEREGRGGGGGKAGHELKAEGDWEGGSSHWAAASQLYAKQEDTVVRGLEYSNSEVRKFAEDSCKQWRSRRAAGGGRAAGERGAGPVTSAVGAAYPSHSESPSLLSVQTDGCSCGLQAQNKAWRTCTLNGQPLLQRNLSQNSSFHSAGTSASLPRTLLD